jgi:hypothetical protein
LKSQEMRRWFSSLQRAGLGIQSAVLVGAMLLAYALVAPVAGSLNGAVGLAAAAVAAGLCLVGAGSALFVCRLFRGQRHALHAVWIGMLLRMGVPLFSALFLQFQAGPLAKAGLLIYLIVFYPVALWVETLLTLPSDERPSRDGGVFRNVVI